ncbi:MAG: hypothetical protein ABJJ37_26995 [Roseibium sp.]
MTGTVSWDQLMYLATLGTLACCAWWFLFSYILAVRKELNEFRIEVAKEYASQELLKDLEDRLVAAVRELKDEFHDMPERLAVLIAAAKTKQD